MPVECAKCLNDCDSQTVRCSQCEGFFHFGCAGISEQTFRGWDSERKGDWKCSIACRNSSSDLLNKRLDIPSVSVNTSKTSLETLASQLNDLCACVTALKKSVDYQSVKFDEVMAKLSKQEDKLAEQGTVIKKLESRIFNLEKENCELQKNSRVTFQSINNIDQYSRNRNIEIHGVEEVEGENLKGFVCDLAKELQIPCDVSLVDVVHRMRSAPGRKSSKSRPIIVQFTNRTTRDLWIAKRKTGLVSKNFVRGSNDQPIYVNVNLSPYYKQLFWKAREAKKQLNYKYCWVNKSGDIYLKKTDSSPSLFIKSEADLPLSKAN